MVISVYCVLIHLFFILCLLCFYIAFRVLVRLLGISLSHDELPGSALPEVRSDVATAPFALSLENRPINKANHLSTRQSVRRRHLKRVATHARLEVLQDLTERFAEARKEEQRERYERNCIRIRQVFDQLTNHSCKPSI